MGEFLFFVSAALFFFWGCRVKEKTQKVPVFFLVSAKRKVDNFGIGHRSVHLEDNIYIYTSYQNSVPEGQRHSVIDSQLSIHQFSLKNDNLCRT